MGRERAGLLAGRRAFILKPLINLFEWIMAGSVGHRRGDWANGKMSTNGFLSVTNYRPLPPDVLFVWSSREAQLTLHARALDAEVTK